MSKPFADGWNINPGFNAKRGEQMPQVVMRQPGATNFFARCRQRFIARFNAANRIFRLGVQFRFQPFKKSTHGGHHWNAARPALLAGSPALGATNHDFVFVKIGVAPQNAPSLFFAGTGQG